MSLSNLTTTVVPIPHPKDEELAAVWDVGVIVIQIIALLAEIIIAIPMVFTLCKSYSVIYSKPSGDVQIEQDSNYDNIKNAQLLHRGRICTLMSIITYIVAGIFIIIQEIDDSPWIVDHLVYVFLILSYTFIFVSVRNIGMEYFLTFINKYCDDHTINNKKRNEFQRLFKGIYNAYGVFSVIYWFGYLLAICTDKNNFIVTAIGLGHMYLAAVTLLHGGMLQAMKNHKDEDSQASRLLDNDGMDSNERTNDNDNDNNNKSVTSSMLTSLNDLDENEENKDDENEAGDDRRASVNINLNVDDNTNQNNNLNENKISGIKGKWSSLPLISKWVYIFSVAGLLLILEGIVYAICYDKNDGDFEFPEVHPFFLFTIFLFFGFLHIVFTKYTWIKN